MFFTCAFCYGGNHFKILSRPDIYIKTAVVAPLQPSLKNETVSFSNVVSLDFSSLYFDFGFSFSEGHTDSVFRSFVKPVDIGWFHVGGSFGYHLYHYYSSFIEQDILSGCYFDFLIGKKLKIQVNSGNILKITSFFDSSIDKRLVNSSWSVGLQFLWYVFDGLSLYFDFKSTDFYDYPFLGTPFFKLGMDIKCTEHFSIGADYTLKMIDMIAVSAAPSEMLLTFYSRVKL